jgi:curved DNA-binding protein CbpA
VTDKDLYKILQVDPDADAEVVTAAYRTLARKLHPDTDVTGIHAVRMAELNRAYSVLRDPAQRRTYDEQRAGAGGAPAVPVGPGHATPERAPADRWSSRREGAEAPELTTLDFGRYAGYSLREIARHDPDYLRWLSRHSSGIRFRSAIANILNEQADPYGARSSR